MRYVILHIAIFLLTALCAISSVAQEFISISREDGKALPLAVYGVEKESCRGVTIISHGAGGSERGYAYLAKAMSVQAYFSVVPNHQESGLKALKQNLNGNDLAQTLFKLVTEPSAYLARQMDILAAKNWAQERCTGRHTILIGHSMGAASTMIEAGAKNKLGIVGANKFDIYIALSPQGVGAIFPTDAWRDIQSPLLSITGTQDDELDGSSWKSRLTSFENMQHGCKWLAVIDGARHMNFAGTGMSQKTEKLTLQTIYAFLNARRVPGCTAPKLDKDIDLKSKSNE
jgi:predicted dienelactone hydrolase